MKTFYCKILLIITLCLAGFNICSAADITYYPKFRADDSNGEPMAYGQVYSYIQGTTTPKATYTDSTGDVANTNPVVLDNKGEADIYTIGPTKLVLKKKVGSVYVTQWEETVEGSSEIFANYKHPDYEAPDQGAADATYTTVKDIIDGLAVDEEATIFFPHNSGGVTTAYIFLTAETIPSNVSLEFENGAMLVPDSGVTVRYGRAPIASSQCFAGDGVILPIDDSDSISHVDVTWYGETAEGIQKADNAASILSSGGKLIIPGKTYYSTDTITLKTKHIVCDGRVDIVKTLSDSPVIILEAITLQEGNLVASHDARPSTSQTEASGIRFRNVVGAKIDKLGAFKVYNAFENVTEVGMSGEQLSWGNVIARLSIREFVNSAIYWDFPGSGNHTGNIFESIYISGFESDGPVYSEVELPIYFNNADSTVINLLNLEACQLTSTASTFIFLENSTSLNIGALHFERNSCIYPGTDRIFNVSASATNPINVLVDTLYINNFTQGASNTRLVVAKAGTATTTGAITINRVSGAITSNTITDFTLLQVGVDCEFRARIVNPDGWDDFLTSLYTGSSPATAFQPNIFMGNEIVSIFPSDALTSGTTTLSIGAASFVTFTGTAPTSITNIEAVPTITDDTYPVEAIRTVTLENSTSGSITVEDTGNINLDTVGGGPITWSENLILNYSIRADKAYVVAYD